MIKIINNIYILPNLFSLKSIHHYLPNINIYNINNIKKNVVFPNLCDYMFILYQNKLILINSTILPYIYNKYPILNLNLILINYDLFNIKIEDNNFLKKLYNENNFIKILNSKNTDNTLSPSLSVIEKSLLINIFNTFDIELMTSTQIDYYTIITNEYKQQDNNPHPPDLMLELNNLIKITYDRIDKKYILKTSNILFGGNKLNDIWYDKYKKYKSKYIELKLKLSK